MLTLLHRNYYSDSQSRKFHRKAQFNFLEPQMNDINELFGSK